MTAEQTIDTSRGGRLRVARSRGAFSGIMLMLLGAWGAIVPFIGPAFSFGFTPDDTWTWTSARGWLEVLPGCVVLAAGFVILVSANRITAWIAGWFAVAGGAWFVVGPDLASVWHTGSYGSPTASSAGMRALEIIAYFHGLGAVIIFFAAFALGLLSVRSLADIRADQRRMAAPVEPMAYPAGTAAGTTAESTAYPAGTTAEPAGYPAGGTTGEPAGYPGGTPAGRTAGSTGEAPGTTAGPAAGETAGGGTAAGGTGPGPAPTAPPATPAEEQSEESGTPRRHFGLRRREAPEQVSAESGTEGPGQA